MNKKDKISTNSKIFINGDSKNNLVKAEDSENTKERS